MLGIHERRTGTALYLRVFRQQAFWLCSKIIKLNIFLLYYISNFDKRYFMEYLTKKKYHGFSGMYFLKYSQFFWIILLIFSSVIDVSAQTDEDIQKAFLLMNAGRHKQESGLHEEAISLFDQSLKITDLCRTKYYKALSLEKTGKLHEAYEILKSIKDRDEVSEYRENILERITAIQKQSGGAGFAKKDQPVLSKEKVQPAGDTGIYPYRFWSYMCGGVSAVLLTGAITMAVFANQDYDKLKNDKNLTQIKAKSLKDDADTQKMVSYILYGTAGATFITSVVLFFIRTDEKPKMETFIIPENKEIFFGFKGFF
jgi:tetratricopeptide (TPR) repeat protein